MKIDKTAIAESKAFKFVKKYWLIIVIAIAAVIVALSSVNIYREEVLEIDPDVTYTRQDTLYFASEPIDTLNPIVSVSEDTYYLSKLIYNSLFDYTDDLNVAGELAESFEVNTEKAYVDITLRNGVKWHDGGDLTASDVRFTVNAIKSAGSKSLYYDSVSKIHSVTVSGDRELRIYFRNNYNCSLDDLIFPILPENRYNSVRALLNDKEDFEPEGTGPYMFSDYDPLTKLQLKPFEDYFGGAAPNSITVNIFPDRSLTSNMMEIGSVTCYTDKSSERKSLVADKGYEMYDLVSNEVDFVVFNTNDKILKSKKIRQAICYAINRDEILDNGYMGDAVLTDTIYYPNFDGVDDTGQAYAFDREKAAEIMAEEGYEDSDTDGRLEDGSGEEISLTILVNKSNATRLAAARIIEDDLEHAGFSATIESVSWDEYTDRIEKRDFDILLTGYEIEASYDLREFFDGKNPWKYRNNEILEKVRELDRLHTPQEYTAAYEQIKELLLDEVPYYALCYKKMGLIGVETFEAQSLPMFNDIYKNCSTWSWSVADDKNTQD